MDTTIVERIRQKYRLLASGMDERMRREWAGAEAAALDWGGVTSVALATGLARNTVAAGIAELRYRQAHPHEAIASRIRRPGAGRKPLTQIDPGLRQALAKLVDPATCSRLSRPSGC